LTIYAVDSDFYVLKEYEKKLEKMCRNGTVKLFTNNLKIWQACQSKTPDLVFVEDDCCGCRPFIEKLHSKSPNTKIVLAIKSNVLDPKMINYNLSGVISKPLNDEQIKKHIGDVKNFVRKKAN